MKTLSNEELSQLCEMHEVAAGSNQEAILAFLRKATAERKKAGKPAWFTVEEIKKGAGIKRHESTFSSLQTLVKNSKVSEVKKVLRGQNVYSMA